MQRLCLRNSDERLLFSELIDEFLRMRKNANLSEKTIEYYEDCSKYFCEFFDKNLPCGDINKQTFNAYIEYLRETKKISQATMKSYLTGLRAIINFGIEENYIHWFKMVLPKMDEVAKETYTDGELDKLLRKPKMGKKTPFSEYRNWVIINYMLATGNRLGTIANIKIEDIDFHNGSILLKKTKGRRQYIIPLSEAISRILKEYLTYRKGEPEDYLFCTVYGKKISERTIECQIARYNKNRGVQKTSVHAFRHTFAKSWILNGGDIFRLQKILGHKSLDMVKKYVNIFNDDLQKDFNEFNPLDNIMSKNNLNGDKIRLNK